MDLEDAFLSVTARMHGGSGDRPADASVQGLNPDAVRQAHIAKDQAAKEHPARV
jgi:hypothetical protein